MLYLVFLLHKLAVQKPNLDQLLMGFVKCYGLRNYWKSLRPLIHCLCKCTASINHNLVLSDRTKQVEVDKHFIKEKLENIDLNAIHSYYRGSCIRAYKRTSYKNWQAGYEGYLQINLKGVLERKDSE